MFIKTEVTLDSGKKSLAYYLDEEGRQLVREIYGLRGNIHNLFTRVESLESQIETLKKLLKPEMKEWVEKKFLKHLTTMPTDRSFRFQDFIWPFRKKSGLHWRFNEIITDVFKETVENGGIEARGSGWYRNQVSMTEVNV